MANRREITNGRDLEQVYLHFDALWKCDILGPIFPGCYDRFLSLILAWIYCLFESMRFGKYGNVTAMIKLLETFWNNALQGKFVANSLLVRRLEIMSAHWRETTTQKGAKKSVSETLMKCNLDILIAHILNYFCCDSKVCMQFLSDDDYQLNNTVRRLELWPDTVCVK